MIILNSFQPDANSYCPSSMVGSEDSDEGNGNLKYSENILQPAWWLFKLCWIFTTETSREEPPITSWNELSIIERVGLNR